MNVRIDITLLYGFVAYIYNSMIPMRLKQSISIALIVTAYLCIKLYIVLFRTILLVYKMYYYILIIRRAVLYKNNPKII